MSGKQGHGGFRRSCRRGMLSPGWQGDYGDWQLVAGDSMFNSGGEQGFTMVELVMVLVLVAILAAYAAPRFTTSDFSVGTARRELIAGIRHAQALSMHNTGSTPYRVTILGDGFCIDQTDGTVVSHPFQDTAGDCARHWEGVAAAPAGQVVRFGTRGTPDWSGNIQLSGGGNSATVTIESETGYAH